MDLCIRELIYSLFLFEKKKYVSFEGKYEDVDLVIKLATHSYLYFKMVNTDESVVLI